MKRMIDTETFLAQCRERLNAGETVPLVAVSYTHLTLPTN